MKIEVHAKWIGAGEHAILRQGGGVVFPCFAKKMTLTYQDSDVPMDVAFEGECSAPLRLMLMGLIEEGLHLLKRAPFKGHISIVHNISPGMGLGFSAALCVAIARLFCHFKWIDETEVFTVAHQLEHRFHGQSSGLDVMGVMYDAPVYFEPGQSIEIIQGKKPPYCLLTPVTSGASATMKAIEKVVASYAEDDRRQRWDDVMNEAALMMKQALESEDHTLFASAIEQGCTCFEAWGLVTPSMKEDIEQLKSLGALAVKPTGAGHGGYLLSMWPKPPPLSLTSLPLCIEV